MKGGRLGLKAGRLGGWKARGWTDVQVFPPAFTFQPQEPQADLNPVRPTS
jgi:hypothetical protein